MMQVVTFVAVAMLSISPAWAAGLIGKHELALVEIIHVNVLDEVIGGCLPNPDALKVEAELILQGSDIAVSDRPLSLGPNLIISAVGYALQNGEGCVVALYIELSTVRFLPQGHAGLVVSFDAADLLSGPKHAMPALLSEAVSENVAELANQILRARQQRPAR